MAAWLVVVSAAAGQACAQSAPRALAPAQIPSSTPATPPSPASPQTPPKAQALSPWDAQLYAAAFDAARHGDFSGAEAKVAQVNDKSLVGLLQLQKLFHSKTYTASYTELTEWLAKYGDLPGAARVWELAKKRKPAGAPDPVPPAAMANPHTYSSLDAAAIQADLSPPDVPSAPLGPKAARQAFNAGDMDGALKIADSNGDRFTAGLAAFRKSNWDDAFHRFQALALDVNEDSWARSSGAYWAARAAIARGTPDQAPSLLKVAAQFPNTFYGQIAERQLGLEPVVRHGSSWGPAAPIAYGPGGAIKSGGGLELGEPEMAAFIQNDPRAHRAMALAELGLKSEAGLELKAGLSSASDEATRLRWTALASGVGAMFAKAPELQVIYDQDYPMPSLSPRGGYTIERALVYALIRRESSFDPKVISYAGAYGLMQLMPATAALVEGDDRLRRYPDMLFEPSINMRVGQDYFAWLLNQAPIDGDILKAVAAYNGGPAPVFQTVRQMPYDTDILLLIESIPVPDSRDYVKRVMASYWIYRRLLGQDTKSLDAVATGARTVNVMLDKAPVNLASASLTGGR
jgi:soluble lytic murein transglycosylase-like protein